MTEPLRHAGVRIPPPLIYVLPLVAAYFVNKLLPLWLTIPESRWMFLLGWLLVFVGTILEISGFATFRMHHTAIVPVHPATKVVQSGPYRFTRNPMYLGMAATYLGVAFLLDSWWTFILLPFVLLAMNGYVIAREERYLSSAFGAEYDAYRARVRRWI